MLLACLGMSKQPQCKEMINTLHAKPKLVFFQFKYDPKLPAFLSLHAREHAKCLSHFFDVTVINQDCDFQQVCDRHAPDLVVFESGVPFASCRKPKIRNVISSRQIPKIGLLNADPFGEGRAGFLSDMDHWGIETFFSIATTTAQHMPELAKNLFIWPNFVDAEVYHDYGEAKTVRVLFTGNKNGLYPWRQNMIRIVSSQYPSIMCSHPGYGPLRGTQQPVTGEPYARSLNSAFFVPACGTVTREVIRKHFEVPASRSCLVTQRSEALEAAGFRDMVNCVFAEEHDVLDKLGFLFEHPKELRAVTDRGYELVHSRHTASHRDQIFQWFTLQKRLTPGSRIVQPEPFGNLEIADAENASQNYIATIVAGSLVSLLERGDDHFSRGMYEAAETFYLTCLSHYRFMPEAQLKIALCQLYKGNAKSALSWATKPIQFTLAEYKAPEPDPAEWAYFIISLLCLGRTREALKRAGQFSWLRHPELDRARGLAEWICFGRMDALREEPMRRSVHRLPRYDFSEWLRRVEMMLNACGQSELVQKMADMASEKPTPSLRTTQASDFGKRSLLHRHKFNDAAREFQRKYFFEQMREAVKRPLRKVVRHARTKYEGVMPGFLTQVMFRGQ
jgi:hypothetical protein